MDFPEDLARKMCELVAKRVLFRFKAFPDFGEDDLVSEGMIAAFKAWPKYVPKTPDNPHAIAPSSFVYMVAMRQLVDLYRTRSRRGEHETKAAEESGAVGDPEEIAEPQDEDDLAEWAAMIYARSVTYIVARGLIDVPRHAGLFRRTYSPAQLLTLVALRKRTGLSCHAAAHLLAKRPDVRSAIRLPRRPSAMVFSRASRSVTRYRPKRVRTLQPAA